MYLFSSKIAYKATEKQTGSLGIGFTHVLHVVTNAEGVPAPGELVQRPTHILLICLI